MRSLPALLAALLLTACTAAQVQTTTQVTGHLATVAAQYDEARAVLNRRIALLPAEQADQWRAVLADADQIKVALESVGVPTQADATAIYATASALYARARALVEPELAGLPLADRLTVTRFDAALRGLATAYQSWTASPGGTESAMITQGLELAKVALQIGLLVL